MRTDRAKATTQAWLEWRRVSDAPFPSDAEVLQLAARREVVRNTTLLRMRKRFGDPS